MAFFATDNRLGQPLSFTQIDSTPNYTSNSSTPAGNNWFTVGTLLRGIDPVFGEGEFMYLPGVASNAVGMVVTYNATTFVVTLMAAALKNSANPLAVSMSANTSTTNYSWYQISGLAVILKTAVQVLPQVPLFSSATAGRVKVLASAGQEVLGCRSANLTTVTSTTSTITALIQRPFGQGQIT